MAPQSQSDPWTDFIQSLRSGGQLKDDEEAQVFAGAIDRLSQESAERAMRMVQAHRERKRITAESKNPDELLDLGLRGKLPGPPRREE